MVVKMMSQHLLNRGQTVFSGVEDLYLPSEGHNTFLIEVKPTTTSGVKPPMACHNTFLIEVKLGLPTREKAREYRHNTFLIEVKRVHRYEKTCRHNTFLIEVKRSWKRTLSAFKA
jgi:hypothetical protein